ncbi:MAG: transcriptional repressor [Oscillospiraceae bacterium]|jgi:Fur family peroxide stress response transcriptional regulator|nr:transcriptional repressor [Oscillospiraceae bacterium]
MMPMTRFSRQRTAVLDTLRNRPDHPTAEEIYHRLRPSYPNISLGTVYRNLALLEAKGEALRIRDPGGPDHYDATTHPHDHLHCRRCGAMVDLPLSSQATLAAAQAAARQQGAVVEACHALYIGLCKTCADENPVPTT